MFLRRAIILLADSHDVSLVKNIIVKERGVWKRTLQEAKASIGLWSQK